MIYTTIISLGLMLIAFLALRGYGIKWVLVSPPILMNMFIIGYTVIGVRLYYDGAYYFLGSDFEPYLNDLYLIISLFNVIFVAAFILGVKASKNRRPEKSEPKITSSFLVLYATPLFAYAALRLSLFFESGSALLNLLMIFFNSLIPIIGYALLKSIRFSKAFLVGFVLLAIFFGFRYRIVLLLLPIALYFFIQNPQSFRSKIILLASVFGGIFLIAIVGVTREYSTGLTLSRLESLSIGDVLVQGVFNDTSTALVSGAVIDQIRVNESYSGFEQLYYILVYFIPSSFVDNKEYSPIFSFVARVTGQYSNESGAAVLGFVEYFHTAGYLGVVLFALVFSVVFARLYKNAVFGAKYEIFFYFVIVAWFINSLTRGYLPQNSQDLMSLWLGLKLIRMKISASSFRLTPRQAV